MIPLALVPDALPLAVAGRGPLAAGRHARLIAAGAQPLFFSDEPAPDIAPDLTRPRLPDPSDLATLRILWVAGLPDAEAGPLAQAARAARCLVNVEDRTPWCDFFSVAEVRRGDLLLAISTGGASPGLASRLRARLETEFGPEWADRLARLKVKRNRWRAMGLPMGEVGRLTEAAITAKNWLP